ESANPFKIKPTFSRQRSPAECPLMSLTSLKPSRSIKMIPSVCAFRDSRVQASRRAFRSGISHTRIKYASANQFGPILYRQFGSDTTESKAPYTDCARLGLG